MDKFQGLQLTGFGVVPIMLAFQAPVAQLDRVPGYEPGGRRFESFRARQLKGDPLWSPFLCGL